MLRDVVGIGVLFILPRSARHRERIVDSYGKLYHLSKWKSATKGLTLAVLLAPALGYAQSSTTLIQPAIIPDYDRDRNISVTERPHPDFDPLGYRVGGFLFSPSLTVSPGLTTNVYTDNENRKSDAFVILEPYVRIGSDWSAHRVSVEASGDIRRYMHAIIRNQNGWNLAGQGRLDISRDLIVESSLQAGRRFESPYSDDVVANTTNLSSYLQSLVSVKATYTLGRIRAVASIDHSSYEFNVIKFSDRPVRNQSYRDRTMNRVTGIIEYALSPSISVYGELIFDKNDYDTLLPNGDPNRDSTGYALIGGSNFDLAGLARGSVGVGFSRRDYKAGLYANASGPSIQAKIEFFPTALTTVGITAQRQIQDAGLGGAGAYSDNRATVRMDHELLENLILTLDADIARRSYLESDQYTSVFSAGAAAKFQMTRDLSFGANIRYGSSDPHDENFGNRFDELRAIVSVRIRR